MGKAMVREWQMRNGTHYFVDVAATGAIQRVLGVVADVEEGAYVGCVHNVFDSCCEFDTLADAQVRIEAMVALEDVK